MYLDKKHFQNPKWKNFDVNSYSQLDITEERFVLSPFKMHRWFTCTYNPKTIVFAAGTSATVSCKVKLYRR